MIIQTKFDLGQQVWGIWSGRKQLTLKCSFCDGIGEISGADGERRSCPECYGRCTKHDSEPEAWLVQPVKTIGQLRVKITDSPGREGEEMFDNYKPQTGREEECMCVETGIGSGSIYNVELLFATKTEAEAECDKRNKAAEKEDDHE